MRLNINTNIQHLREDEIISILNESDNKYPESARVADDISAYPAHSNTTGSNRLTSLTDFLAMMSHNLRTSLNGVLGLTSLLFNTHLTAEQRYYIGNIQESSDDLLSLATK